ncbi:nuclear pore complex protein NUP98A isoform X1 [Lingula anatina]|uniref:Nuclear pore complex protein NUP98A isoform X1 n=1 Tax=Lingula anatina TaxID=7574 RepID=A0A1S3IFK3_LINAN|nr:nuclear pore complex protein NUP98A isoform X1 [Lingula anatina]|eukprot:XP_013397045.1 nuclear pore complex protein NUP98A isoform X1 [Lingula anatina]
MWKLFCSALLASVLVSSQGASVAEEHSVHKRQVPTQYGANTLGGSFNFGPNIGVATPDQTPAKDTIVVSDVGKASITRTDGPNYTPSGPNNYNAKVWQLGNQEVTYVGNVVIIDWRVFSERKAPAASRTPVYGSSGPTYGTSGPTYGSSGPTYGSSGSTFGPSGTTFGPSGPAFGTVPQYGDTNLGQPGSTNTGPAYGQATGQDPTYGTVGQDTGLPGFNAGLQDPGFNAGLPGQGFPSGLPTYNNEDPFSDPFFQDVPGFYNAGQDAGQDGSNSANQAPPQNGGTYQGAPAPGSYQNGVFLGPTQNGGYQDQGAYQGLPNQGGYQDQGAYQGLPNQGGAYQGAPAQGSYQNGVFLGPTQNGGYQDQGAYQGLPNQGGVYQGAPAQGGSNQGAVYQDPTQTGGYQDQGAYQGLPNQGGLYQGLPSQGASFNLPPQTGVYSGAPAGNVQYGPTSAQGPLNNQYGNALNQYGKKKRRRRSLRKKRQTYAPSYGTGPLYGQGANSGVVTGLPLYGQSPAYGSTYGSYNVPTGPAFPNICVKRGTYLVFNWPYPGRHNVNKFISYRAYKYCSKDELTEDTYGSQTQEIIDTSNLAPGYYYFASGVGDDCSTGGQKIAVRVATDYGDDCKYPSYGQYGLAGASTGK